MFDLFRSREKSVRILLGVLLGLVAVSMLIYLIPGGPGSTSAAGQNTVAMVGNEKITTQDLQQAIQRITRNQSQIPKSLLAQYIPAILNQLIDGKAMAYRANEVGITVSDHELANMIQENFSAEVGSQFDMNVYQMALAQQGMTVTQYENQQREVYLAARLEALELGSMVVSEQEAKAEYQRKNLKAGLQYLEFQGKAFTARIGKDQAAMKAYFEKNRGLFQTAEKRDIELITGSTADFTQNAKVPDAELQRQYQTNLESYRVPERVNVRHILIKTQGKPKEEQAKMKAKAEDILKQLHNGGDFAELAKKNSEDPGSGAKGGDLGWVVRGQTVANFEKSAFSLKPKELSGLVETEFGYHIIQVMDKQLAHVQAFDEVKPQLLAEAQKEAGSADLKKAINNAHNEVVKNPSQAPEIAKKYNLKFFRVDKFSNFGSLPEVNTQPEVFRALSTTPKGGVSGVVDLEATGKAAFGIVNAIYPAHNSDFAEAEKEAQDRYTTAESLRLMQEAAKSAAERAKKGESLEALAKEYGISVKTAAPFTIDGAAEGIGSATYLSQAFKGNVGDVFGPVAIQASEFVCKIGEKVPADMVQFAKDKDQILQQIRGQKNGIQQQLFRESVVSDLKKRGKVKLNEATINRLVTAYQS